MYTVRYQNVAKYFGGYQANDIPTNFQKYPINTAFYCLRYRHKTRTNSPQKYAYINISFANKNKLVAADNDRSDSA